MPLYEYACERCGHVFEVLRKFSDPPVEHCPSCGGKVHKEQSSPAFQFKGTGWYVTDYAKKGAAPKDSPRADAGKDAGKKAEGGGTDAGKPAKPAETATKAS